MDKKEEEEEGGGGGKDDKPIKTDEPYQQGDQHTGDKKGEVKINK